MSINRCTISGNIGKAPELKVTTSSLAVLSFSVCVNERVKRNGEWEDKANWLDVVMFGSRAESVSRYLSKGSHVTVAGRLSKNTWEAQDGSKRSKVEIICEDIDFTGTARRTSKDEGQALPGVSDKPDVYDEDIPF